MHEKGADLERMKAYGDFRPPWEGGGGGARDVGGRVGSEFVVAMVRR
jgi:hypothetical protein